VPLSCRHDDLDLERVVVVSESNSACIVSQLAPLSCHHDNLDLERVAVRCLRELPASVEQRLMGISQLDRA
jgi:hypothetical protein